MIPQLFSSVSVLNIFPDFLIIFIDKNNKNNNCDRLSGYYMLVLQTL